MKFRPAPKTVTDGAFANRVDVSWPAAAGADSYQDYRGYSSDSDSGFASL